MLKRKPGKIEACIVFSLIVAVGLYFYIDKIHGPAYKKFTQTNTKLKSITNEVESLGPEPDIKGAEESLLIAESEAEEVSKRLKDIIDNTKTQTIDTAMDVIVQINTLSLRNRVEVESLMLSNREIKLEQDVETDEESSEPEEIPEEVPEGESENQEGEDIEGIIQNVGGGIVNEFDWEIYDINITGSYINITNFVNSLGNTNKVVRIDYINFNRIGEEDIYKAFLKLYI